MQGDIHTQFNNKTLVAVCCFAGGILMGRYVPLPDSLLLWLVLCGVLLLLVLLVYNPNVRVLPTITALLIMLLAGYLQYALCSRVADTSAFIGPIAQRAVVFGAIENKSLLHDQRFTVDLLADSILFADKKISGRWKLRLSIHHEEKNLYAALHAGNNYAVNGLLSNGEMSFNPGDFDYHRYLLSEGFSGVLHVGKKDSCYLVREQQNGIETFRETIRTVIAEKSVLFFGRPSSGLVDGLLLGDKYFIDKSVQESFINAGVAHVLAVSGLNVMFIGYLVLLLASRFNLEIRYLLMLLAVLAFWFVAGSSPAVNRAVIMAVLLAVQVLLSRKVHMPDILCGTLFLSLLLSPDDLFTPGFQLSFAGVFALVYTYPRMEHILSAIKPELPRKLLRVILLTFTATLGTLPVTMYYFGKISITALAANIIIVPLTGYVMGGAIIVLLIGSVLPIVGTLGGAAVTAMVQLTYSIVKLSGGIGSWLPVGSVSVLTALAGMLLFIWFSYSVARFNTIAGTVVYSCLLIALYQLLPGLSKTAWLDTEKMTVLFADVGQGDASLILLPNGTSLLIDAGYATEEQDYGRDRLLPLFNSMGIKRVDYGIITHYDADHYKGMLSLIRTNRIKTLILPPGFTRPGVDTLIKQFSTAAKVPVLTPIDTIWHLPNARIYFTGNEPGMSAGKSLNDRCLALKLQYGETSFLFTGDAQAERERQWLQNIPGLLPATVLKVAHHGSKFGTSEQFLRSVNPEFAVISCGRQNLYGHPHAELIDRLKSANIQYWSTHSDGAVILQSDGSKVSRVNWRE